MHDHSSIFINMLLKSKNNDWLSLGVKPVMIDSSVRSVYLFVTNHYNRYDKMPSRKEVASKFPVFRFLKAREPIAYYAAELIKSYKAAKLRQILSDTADSFASDDINSTFSAFKKQTEHLFKATASASSVNFARVAKDAESLLTKKMLSADIPFGDPMLDRDLIGLEKGDWAMIAGSPAAGKTWLLLKLLNNLWRFFGLNILLFSLELSTKLINRRLIAINGGIPYDRLRRNRVTKKEKARLRKFSRKKYRSFFEIVSSREFDYESGGRLGDITTTRNYIRQLNPDLVAIDGLYIAMDMDKWGETQRFCNDFHTMLQETGVPAITTSQLKNVADPSKPRLRDLAFTAAFQQATDFVFLLAKDEKMRNEGFSILHVGKAREVTDCQTYMLNFNPGAVIRLEPLQKQINNPLMGDD